MGKESIPMTIVRLTIGPLFLFLFRPRIIGRENIMKYKRGAVIIASNHTFELDVASMAAPMPRNLHFLSKIELSRGPLGWFFRRFGLVFVDRDKKNHSVQAAAEFLRAGMAIGIFPEGTTRFKKANELLPFKFGAVKMAAETGAPLLPMAVSGRYRLFGIGRRLTIRFGQPIFIKKEDDLEKANEKLRDAIAGLLKKDGVEVVKLLGRPARNPSKTSPILDDKKKGIKNA
jgi:1-acyl-sn-glycerol-3-phosphate acyltransferase